jgi:hypothetical protein
MRRRLCWCTVKNLSVTGAIFLVMAGSILIYKRRKGSGPSPRQAVIQITVALSPVVILVGVVMMIAAVV